MKVVILTPVTVEHDAVKELLTNIKENPTKNRFYLKGTFSGKHHEYTVYLEETGSTNPTISNAATQAISNFDPAIVLLVGIAGGVKDVEIGDVVVGTKSYGYEVGKETDSGLLARPFSYEGSKDLQVVARSVKFQKQWVNRSPYATEDTKVLFGPIAGGEKVIATSSGLIADFLKKSYNDTVALEMEAYGFGQALSYHQNIRWLNIRSISDTLSGKSASDATGSQRKAAWNAAAFAFELLNLLDGNRLGIASVSRSEDTIDVNTITSSSAVNLIYPGPAASLQAIRGLMTSDKIKEALEALLIYTKGHYPDLHNDIIAQSGRWNRLKRDKRQGVITNDESQIIHNRIRYSILSIIEELED